MLLHSQKSLYYADGEEITNLTDIVLVAINEVTKIDPDKRDDGSYNYGVDFSNIPPFNPYMIAATLEELGYNAECLESNGWEHDYWQSFYHPDNKKFPPMQTSGTSLIHQCRLHGNEEKCGEYPRLEDNPEYADRIKHGLELLKKAMDRAE